MLTFHEIVKKVEPAFIDLSITELFPRPKFYIVYCPGTPILTKMFNGLRYPKELKIFSSTSSALSVVDSWRFLKVYEYTYMDFEILNFQLREPVDLSKLTLFNITKTRYHVQNITFISHVIGRYDYELSISKDFKNSYLTILFIIKCAMYSMDLNEKIPEVAIAVLPNSIFYGIQWPTIQLMFYYFLFGCIILHIKTIRRLSKGSLFPQKGWYTIVTYLTLLIYYTAVCALIFLATCFILCTDYISTGIILTIPWYITLSIFFINVSTILYFGLVLCELDMTTYNSLYFIGIIMAPQLLYLIAFGLDGGTNCYFQYLTCFSPLFAIGWSLVLIEDIQSKYRFNISTTTLKGDLYNNCFSFGIAISIQLGHILIYIIFIFYMNFATWTFINFEMHNTRRIKRHYYKKYCQKPAIKLSNRKCHRQRSIDSIPQVVETVNNRYIIFPKCDFIITTHKVMKIFRINGEFKNILKGVNVKFRKNKITTILGPNGSGKSTFLGILSGAHSVTSGDVFINGKSIISQKAEAYSNISTYVDEIRAFNFLTVTEYFELVIHKNGNNNYDVLHHRLIVFVEICQLEPFLPMKLKYCAPSITRLIKIISTFLSDKPIILLDDPMDGLDYILVQNVCALLCNQKSYKTIIYTSCNSEMVEYVTDSVIVLINGRTVSQADIENFNIDKMLYKLVCSMEPQTSDYTLTRYLRLTFPMIKYEETVQGVAYFNVPQMHPDQLWDLLDKLDRYGGKLGIWRYKFLTVGMRHHLSNAYDHYLKIRKKNRIIYKKIDTQPAAIRKRSEIYRQYFILLMTQRVISYCRYPSRLLMRFFLPLIVLIIWASSTSLSHPTIFLMDNGFHLPSYKDEINKDHTIYVGCEGQLVECKAIFKKLESETVFIKNRENILSNSNTSRENFELHLFNKGEKNYTSYTNFTLFALYFAMDDTNAVNATIFSNDYKSQIYAYILADSILMFPKRMNVKQFVRTDLILQQNLIEINYLLKLIMTLLFAYSLTTYRYVSQHVQQQFYLIHKLAGVHFSLIYIPAYLMDVFLYLLITCFMILFVHIMHDYDFTIVRGRVVDIISIFILFVLADTSFKLLVEYLTDYNPVAIFTLKCLDLFVVNFLNVIYFINFVIRIQKYSYGGLRGVNISFRILDIIFKIIFPSANLNAGLRLEKDTLANLNSVLFIQWIFYLSAIFIWHYQKFRIRKFLKPFRCCFVVPPETKVCILGKENSYLYVRNVSLFHNNRLYFENFNIEFEKGTVWGVIGRNHSGKTHFLNIILGKQFPTTGGVYFYNKLVKTLHTTRRNIKIGYCSERKYFVPDLTVEEILIYWSRIQLLPELTLRFFVSEIIEILLLDSEINRHVKDLTKNNIKKLDIAMSVIGYPDIILLDDPLSSLDSLARQGVINLIDRAKSNNCTVIITASEVSELRHTITHLAVIANGTFIYKGPFVDAIADSRMGYYLTIFMRHEYIPKRIGDQLTITIAKTFRNSLLFKFYQSHLIYFIPFQVLSEPNTTKILLFMETIRAQYRFDRFDIKYDIFFSNPD